MFIRVWKKNGRHEDFDSSCAELHYDDHRVIQLHGDEATGSIGKYATLRVWPENGTSEYGGSNGDAVMISLRPDGTGWKITNLYQREAEGHHVDDVKKAEERAKAAAARNLMLRQKLRCLIDEWASQYGRMDCMVVRLTRLLDAEEAMIHNQCDD